MAIEDLNNKINKLINRIHIFQKIYVEHSEK